MPMPRTADYSLTGPDTALAIRNGLAEATWYASPVPKELMRELLVRRDGPAIRDTLIWFALIIGSGVVGAMLWGSWLAVIPFAIYATLYSSTADSRWHESSHGTAFKTDWLNDALYEIASFMMMRESTPWRWSHTRHHSDTIIVGRDPEIFVPRPANLVRLAFAFIGVQAAWSYVRGVVRHAVGVTTAAERTYIPASAFPRVFWTARIHLAIYLAVIGLAVGTHSLLPLMYVGIPNLVGPWLMLIYGLTQHAGLAENVLDHRLNCRTVTMNWLNRYLYWNMNYHVEHHMFPMVPYHQLPRLHAAIRDDCPAPYPSIWAAYREIIPALIRNARDPSYFVRRELPPGAGRTRAATAAVTTSAAPAADGWVDVCAAERLQRADALRFDHDHRTFAIYRTEDDRYFATDGICSHGSTHLADGFVKGDQIECPKHNGRFSLVDGSPQRAPVCVALRTYPVRVAGGRVHLNPVRAGGQGADRTTRRLRVVRNEHVATFIKELVLEPEDGGNLPSYQPGEYLQFEIPAYAPFSLSELAVPEPYAATWRSLGIGSQRAQSPVAIRRTYSLATDPASDRQLRFNIRLATAPRGQEVSAGAGSAYMHRLKPGDVVSVAGPFGDFHIRHNAREMVYLGGGAGMAPLRSHLAHLLETHRSPRTISYWYGARSLQEVFYRDYFEDLAQRFSNFRFTLALSEPQPGDAWTGDTGFIHQVLFDRYLRAHPDPRAIDFYLCGPPAMLQAAKTMLAGLGVTADQIAYDEF